MLNSLIAMSSKQLNMHPAHPFRDFREASQVVLRLLQQWVGLGLWLVTRTEGEDWIVLTAQDQTYDVKDGDVFRWSDSFCSRMVQGLGPRIAPRSAEIPAYAEAPIGQRIPINAYIGIPLTRPDGSLFGTLCAIDPESQPDAILGEQEIIETYARLLSTILSMEMDRQQQVRLLERAEVESQTDSLTGLYNRRGWGRLMIAEEERCRRYGNPAGIVVVDLDGLKEINDEQGHAAGDRVLRATADVLRSAARQTDVVARLGGDEFMVLAVETNPATLEGLANRLRDALVQAGIDASLGWAARDPQGTLEDAQQRADQQMYRSKRDQIEAAGTDDRKPQG